ncbi:MAG: 3-mercaptopyruvate sulfurtransferase [Pseudomonadota bacterium]
MDELIGPLISVETLAECLRKTPHEVQIVDGSWRLSPDDPPARSAFEKRRIPGAVFFDIDKVCDRTSPLPHMLPTQKIFNQYTAEAGLSPDKDLIVYDDQGLFSAARVWWTFRAMGWPRVTVLDGGLPLWINQGHVLERDEFKAVKTCSYSDHQLDHSNKARVATADDVLAATRDQDALIIDARPAPRFLGEQQEPRPGLRSGAIPGALNIPFTMLIDKTARLKSKDELFTIFNEKLDDDKRPLIATCGSGVTAAIVILALEVLGRFDHALYDGSFAEWGNVNSADRFPVTTAR